ncbi:DUF6069 family protein [Micromonospora sp. NPDC005161]
MKEFLMTTTSAPPIIKGLRPGALAVGTALVATTLLWTAAQIVDIEMRVDPGNGQPPLVVSLPLTATVTLAVSLLAWGVRALLERLTRRAAVVWTVLAVIVLLASLLPPLGVEATGAAKAILMLMHVAVAAVLIPGLVLQPGIVIMAR